MASAPAYFVDHKRGEVNELKALLRNQRVEKDPAKKREVIKKVSSSHSQSYLYHTIPFGLTMLYDLQVIAYMTLGIDVSKIFSEMVMVGNKQDLTASSI
jgi:AP-4 complex subunit beta-1